MEPMLLASSFATIVGLLSDFAASRGQNEILEIRDFTEWLRTHGHNELLGKIQQNTETTISIKASLAEGRTELLSRLNKIESLLAFLSSGQGPLGNLASALVPKLTLSPQTLEILIAFESAEASRALVMNTFDGTQLLFMDGVGSQGYVPTDPRFFDSDVQELSENALCTTSKNNRGETVLVLTRRGASIARQVISSGVSQ